MLIRCIMLFVCAVTLYTQQACALEAVLAAKNKQKNAARIKTHNVRILCMICKGEFDTPQEFAAHKVYCRKHQ